MLYLCLPHVCISTHTKPHNIHSLYFVLGLLCMSKSPIFDKCHVHASQWKINLLFACQTPSCNTDDFLLTLWCSKWSCCVVHLAGDCPTFKHFTCFRDWPQGAVTLLPSSSNTHTHTAEQTQAKITHNPCSETHLSSAWFALKFG